MWKWYLSYRLTPACTFMYSCQSLCCSLTQWFEPPHDKTNKMTCAPREGSDQPGHPPSLMPSLIRVFAMRSKDSQGPKASLCGQQTNWSDWMDAQADLSLCWEHIILLVLSFCGSVIGNQRKFQTIAWHLAPLDGWHLAPLDGCTWVEHYPHKTMATFLTTQIIWASSRGNLSSGFATR